MARKTVPILIVVLIVMASLLIFQQVRISKLQTAVAKYEQKELQNKIRELIFSFAIPSEALYYDKTLIRKVADLRFDSYVQHHTPYLVSYASILRFLQRKDFLEDTKYDWEKWHQKLELNKSNASFMQDYAFERCLLDLQYKSLHSFAFDHEDRSRLGAYFKDHPDEFERFVKPWVTRALGGYYGGTKLEACRVLLAWGDRTHNIKTTLRQLTSGQSPWWAERAKKLAAKYNLQLEPSTE